MPVTETFVLILLFGTNIGNREQHIMYNKQHTNFNLYIFKNCSHNNYNKMQ